MIGKWCSMVLLLALTSHVVQNKSLRNNLSRLLKRAKFTSELISPHHLIVEGTTTGKSTNIESLTISELTTETSNDSDISKSSIEEQYSTNQTSIVLPTTTLNPLVTTSSNENRLRLIDSWLNGAVPGYLPRVPNVPGIPSGFRNPLANTSPPMPLSSSTSTTTTTSTTTSTTMTPTLYNPASQYFFHPTITGNDEGVMIKPLHTRRPNITRVEHIAAECSNEYMKVDIRFNGTFSGLIYSSGYVHDPNCIYVNGSGRNVYEFYIRLNQCGTLGRQEMYHPTKQGEARRRDQLMWNTLSIQYNALIEEEFDEHFRLTCEYGSDFWKTVTFPSFNVEINTGSPVVFTINPPQCQMEIRRGFGIAGTRTSGPVTVGDPLTLLIHMKSEKVGFDILVKNCVAHNGAQQRMLLIDSNGCVTNDKLISPFRGTYNAENGHMVSLYSYLKAFRFTGSPALYLECDIHMCHNRCPPQRCYWRNLSKRSAKFINYDNSINSTAKPILSESIQLFQALEVHHEQDESSTSDRIARGADDNASDLICIRSGGLMLIFVAFIFLMSISLGTSICYCLRMRRLKYIARNAMLAKSDYAPSCRSSHSDQSSSYSRNFFRF